MGSKTALTGIHLIANHLAKKGKNEKFKTNPKFKRPNFSNTEPMVLLLRFGFRSLEFVSDFVLRILTGGIFAF
ncbi:hypothetical protein BMS3Abin05_01210 [bacterium BMS3Abin05]|nr:hypothetical protein BMS3Abin05_01210 [bacterium BMS3Abin05]GBE28876.1 hypothetical protein BMS3Bbin03_02829 [bacterium BMS3Bbin03]